MPKHCEPVAGARLITHSLDTKDLEDALRRWPSALKWWEEKVAEWERQLTLVPLDAEAAEGIARRWQEWVALSPEADRTGLGPADRSHDGDPAQPYPWPPESLLERHTEAALKLAKISVDQRSMGMLRERIALRIMAEIDWAETGGEELDALARSRLPQPVQKADHPPPLTLDDLVRDWEQVATVEESTKAEARYAVNALAAAVGHRDARKITRDDLRRWRDTLKGREKPISNNTWNNRLSLLSQVFLHAVNDGKLSSNPTDRLRLKKSKNAPRFPYSDEDAVKILTAARLEDRLSRRWTPWIMAFSGMRLGEALQLTAGDIQQDPETGIWFISVNEDDEKKTVKNGQRRHVPIHPAILQEGLLGLLKDKAPDDPLFPDKKLDVHGKRGGKGWQVVGRWVREKVGITDPNKSPNHSWRHRMEDELRAVEVPEEVRDAILGHARKTVGRAYGVRGEALSRLHGAISKVPNPVAARRSNPG